jgi:hypothetical protein
MGQMTKRIVLLILGALVLTLLAGGIAVAGYTPQDIYDDYRLDGDLDHSYSDAELRAYVNDAQLHEYGDSSVTDRLDKYCLDRLTRETFPFTGFQLAMAGIVVVVLIGGGVALRRFARVKKPTDAS